MRPHTSSQLLVKGIMATKPITVSPTTSPRELARILVDHSISGVPVVDDQGLVVGVVSKTNLLEWCVRGGLGFGASDLLISLAIGGQGSRLEAIDLGVVADFMSTKLVIAHPNELVIDVARRMAMHQVHRVIVVDERAQLCGVLTSMDVLRVFQCLVQHEAA
jgi:CBS domain-containing protein